MGLGSTLVSPPGVVVSGAVGVSDAGVLGLCGEGDAGLRGAGWSLITWPMVVPLPLPPMVVPLAHSKPVMSIMASRKAPSAPPTMALQRRGASRRKRSPIRGPRSVLSVGCSSRSGASAASGWERVVLGPCRELGDGGGVWWASERADGVSAAFQ